MNSVIENLNGLGGQFLNFAWPMLWQSSLLIALVFLADVLTARKIRASVRHALWLVVLMKLLLPPTLALPTGAAWWLFPVKPVVLSAVQPPVANNYSVVVDDAPLPEDFTPEPVARIEPPKPKLSVAGWMLLACSVVSGGLLGWLLFRWGQLAQKVRGAAKVLEAASPENVQEAFERARLRAGLRAGARLKLVEGNMSPAVCGLLRPVILLPRILVEKLSAAQLQAVLLHEMIHLRRKDIWVNCAQSLLQIFYWWHPLVWVANARIRRVREEAVDDAVMLALAEDAETYAPTLLEVAKLAFRRPLLSLGLVGIMESRSALRQRIERLMDFHAPRKAGLTLVSVCGIFVFSAVAVPMGQGPARVAKGLASNFQTTESGSSGGIVLVGDTFTNINIGGTRIARLNADGSLDLNFINASNALLELVPNTGIEKLGEPKVKNISGRRTALQNENVVQWVSSAEYEPLLYNVNENQIGDSPFPMTVATREPLSQAEMLAQINQSAVPAHGSGTAGNSAPSPDGQTTNTPQVLITAVFYRIKADDFESLTSGLQFNRGTEDEGEWWSGARDGFSKIQSGLKTNGLVPLSRPRILTLSGKPAQMHIGNGTNWIELDCLPLVNGTNVDLKISGEVVGGQEGVAVTNEFKMDAPVQSEGGMVIRARAVNGSRASNVVVILTAKILSESESARFQQRLVRITKPAVTNGVEGNQTSSPTAGPADEPAPQLHIKARFISVPRGTLAGLEYVAHSQNPTNDRLTGLIGFITSTNARAVLQALRAQKGVETLAEPEYTLLSNRRTQMRATDMVTVVTNVTYNDHGSEIPQTAAYELGAIFDVTPHVLSDGFTINLKAVAALTEFLGYREISRSAATIRGSGLAATLPGVAPVLQTQKLSVEANLRDDQTLVFGGLTSRMHQQEPVPKAGDVPPPRLFQANEGTNDVLVFITATIVDPAGSRVHAEGELAPGQSEIPEQPAMTNSGGVEFSVPEPAQLPGHGAVPRSDPGGTDRLLLEGKKLYEGAMLNEAKAKFSEVIRSEPKNATALYYLGLIEQTQEQMPGATLVQRTFVLPALNYYATNHLIFTRAGRQAIVAKLDKIHLDTVSFDGLPLNEVLKQLSEQCRLRDPEHKGINFLINNNPDLSAPPGSAVKVASSGPNLDPATGFLLTPAATEPPDVGSYIIKIPSLTDVRMTDVLDAIELVSDHPLKYSIQDFAVVFSANSEPQLFMRTFRVDPNTFYSGLENDSDQSFGAVRNGRGGGGGSGQNNGAVVGVVNAFSGASSVRSTGGGGGSQVGSGSVLNNQTDGSGGGGRTEQSLQGSSYVTARNAPTNPSALARTYFSRLGVNLNDPPGKSVFYNDQKGSLFVKATEADLNTIEKALQAVNQTPPQLHIKARFIEVPKGMRDDLKATNPVFGKPIWILTDPNFRAILRDLASRENVENLGEPEITTLSGRQTQMRATEMVTVVTNVLVEPGSGFSPGDNSLVPQTSTNEVGPILDVVPYVLADGYTINLSAIRSLKEFLGYEQTQPQPINSNLNQMQLPRVLPKFQTQQIVANANLWDNQTLVLGGLTKQVPMLGRLFNGRDTTNMDVLVFITVTIVDPAGRRVHTDDDMPFAKGGVPTQPAGK